MAVWDIKERYKKARANEIRGSRGMWLGGGAPGINATVDYITFSTSGNATDFGDLTVARDLNSGGANFTRALCTGGGAPGVSDVMDYVAIASTGNFADFGNLTDARGYTAGMANNTRQVTTGGLDPSHSNIMDYVEIASTGNAVDFGDTTNVTALHTCQGSPTRGINAGGVHNPGSVTNLNIINFFQFATAGNATDFGDLTATQRSQSSFGSRTRMCMAGGQAPGTTKIEKIEIGSLGNATDFAEAISGTTENGRGTSDGKKGIYCRGGVVNTLHQLNIVGGTVTDFGDLTVARTAAHAASNGHGGLDVFHPRTPELYSPTGRPVVHGDTAGLGDIGLFQSGGYGYVKNIDYIKISSASNGTDFGDTATSGSHQGGAGSSTRAFQACFASPGVSTNIDYGLFSTKGNHADFGDTTHARDKSGALSNNTRAVWCGGRDNVSTDNLVNIIDYITMATIGNASDFGDLAAAVQMCQGFASNTRGAIGGGQTPSDINVIQYITIGSTGNTTDFGDLTVTRSPGGGTGASSTTRGLFVGGGVPGGSNSDVIDYITIASTGDATDFGDLAFVTNFASGLSNNTRGVFSGFNNTSAPGANTTFGQTPHISYVTIASTGNITNFGDLAVKRYGIAAASNGHGGLS